jgi:predicted Zn-dependent protease
LSALRHFLTWTRRGVTGSLILSLSLMSTSTAVAQSPGGLALLRDVEIEGILHQEADPIFRAAGFDPKNVTILLIGDKSLNAFATSGQIIGINTGLILQSETPNQLKGVIAHESGHLAGGHPIRSGEMTRAGLEPMILTMGLGVLALLAGAPDAGAVLLGNAGYFGTLGALAYSREQEARADQAAVGFLEATNQSAAGLTEFFDNFRYQEVFSQSRRYPYFQSHPLSSERIELLRSRAQVQPHFDAKDSEADLAAHAIMKAKIDGFMNPGVAIVKYKETDTSFPARYARAIAYYQLKEPEKAISHIDRLLADFPSNPFLWELKGQVLFEFGRAAEAEAAQRQSVALKPEAALLHINLGQTLISLDDPAKRDEGIRELRKALTQEQDNTLAWRLLAQAYDNAGADGMARLATAESYFSQGAERESRLFAMRARELLPKGSPEWRRATDIVLVSGPSPEDVKSMGQEEASRTPSPTPPKSP